MALGMWLRSRETLAQQRIETARLNEQLAVAELNALRQQIEPHFLFNTLNGIVALMREQRVEPAIGAIVDLSELLRGTLQRSNRPFVTLLEELELLGHYLDIRRGKRSRGFAPSNRNCCSSMCRCRSTTASMCSRC